MKLQNVDIKVNSTDQIDVQTCKGWLNPLTPMCDQDGISPYNININININQYQADKWWEWRKILIRGLLVDPISNSQN